MRRALIGVGVALFVAGLFFMAQATGWIRWPADSFMIGAPAWRTYGGAIAVTGLVLVLIGRRLRK